MFALLLARCLSESFEREKERSPIRVFFAVSGVNDGTDKENQCRSIEQPECTESEIVSDKTKEKIERVTAGVTDFLQNFIKTNRLVKPITLINDKHAGLTPKDKEYSTDLYIQVAVRKSSKVGNANAESGPVKFDDKMRIIQASIVYSAKFVNENEGYTYEDDDRTLFTTTLHEVFHMLGIRHPSIKDWVDPSTQKRYENPLSTFSHPQYHGKSITLLQTPNAMRFAQSRFGIKYFVTDKKEHVFGIELEDFGDDKYDHPEGRVYYNDIMVSEESKILKISDVTIALLLDTGYYDVNVSYAEPLSWGSAESLGVEILENFSTDPAPLAYPEHYLCTDKQTEISELNSEYSVCAHDFYSTAKCQSVEKIDCSVDGDSNKNYCNGKAFYNPNNDAKAGKSPAFDFSKLRRLGGDIKVCQKSQKCAMVSRTDKFDGAYAGECLEVSCSNTMKSYTIKNDGKEHVCTKKGEIHDFGTFKVTCEDPQYYCSIDEYTKNFKSFFTPDDNLVLILVISIGGVSGVAVATGVSYYFYRKKKDQEEESSQGVLEENMIDDIDKEAIVT